MKILAASDIHGDKKIIDNLVKKAEKERIDLIILCGDLTFAESDLTGLIGPFKKLNKKIIIIPGNHETVASTEFLAKQYKPGVYDLHGKSILLYDEIGLFGFGGANIGLFDVTENEIKSNLEKALEPIKNAKKKIMITHMPPYNTNLDLLWQHTGSKSIREIIEKEQPDLCLCGHIHETFGKYQLIGKTKVINVGQKGVIIDVTKNSEVATKTAK